ncbi:hypothetical protein KXW98_007270 [Aspergillus fumigatus]|nr:hypothetical protein KXX45_009063 [Aspergillus fumigatus]KAH1285322.1 hypothetical protein KXX48_001125 [Aspergillus fumigatus]KAH1287853.1 hypothetical protein KXX30_008075 [Aspergillus fumigatus]KAH1310837.1 hypothetical protein KXX66_008748 [Aspergillus fumigatus]KAH1378842.1 hypothetical protein KXX10_008818 [Aspergillus fumigatus]
MPRPPTKRNRLTSRHVQASPKVSQKTKDPESKATANNSSPLHGTENDKGLEAQPAPSVDDIKFARQLRGQTPMNNKQEQAIASSPMGERGATGSRPPTRARGYSSTLSVGRRGADMSSKIPGTPVFESSILSNFRRRPRQASILQMMQADDGSSDFGDLDDDDFLGGLSPEDESTPLNVSRGKSLVIRHPSSSPLSDCSHPSNGGSRKRKRTGEELQVPQSPLAVVEYSPAGSISPERGDEEHGVPREILHHLADEEGLDRTVAPPLSSSSMSSPQSSHLTVIAAKSPTDSLKHTKDHNTGEFSGKLTVSTASLQDRLLPRRHKNHRRNGVPGDLILDGESEVDYSVDQDEDELSYLPTRKPAQPRRRKNKPKPLEVVRAKHRKQGATKALSGELISQTESAGMKDTRQKRVNGPRSNQTADADKENQAIEVSSPLSSPLDTDAFDLESSPVPIPAKNYLSEELRLQAKKFEEIDRWEMDFEDVRQGMMAAVDAILAGKYPAKAHARRVAESLQSYRNGCPGIVYLEAQKTRLIEDNDEPAPFRQRRPFFYLSGCPLPDSCLVYDLSEDQLTLFIPPVDPEDVIWSGLPMSTEEAQNQYDVDRVLVTTELNSTLASIVSSHGGKAIAFTIADQVSESTQFHGFSEVNHSVLKGVIEQSRVVKDEYEVALLRKANDISAKAHIAAIKASQTAVNEREIEGAFIATCIANGAREQSYHPIVACGENGATLHYGKNDDTLIDPVTNQKKRNVLIDAGGEYRTYCADITRVIPVGGKFTAETRQIYDIVLQMQTECIAMLKEGVQWEDVHAHAHRVAIRGLLKLGILRGAEDEIFEKRVSVAFFPHGLGHYLGMDTHDTGGNPNYADKDTMFRYLRVRGRLPAGSVITVEPGVYFCRFIIEPYIKSPESNKYIDTNVLDRYWRVGGVRIEDNVLVTKDGYDNLTTAPKAVDELERLAAS